MALHYWKKHHFKQVKDAASYGELFLVARDVLKSMPPPVGQVCGPISTGGAGSVERNLKRFDAAILKLQEDGVTIFNQVPFEEPMQRIKKMRERGSEYDKALLTEFYLPIFEAGLIQVMYFLPDWETSVGARWEHEQAGRFGFDIVYLD